MTTTTTNTTATGPYSQTVQATAARRAGADKWQLADALLAEVPQGDSRAAFNDIRERCEAAGVRPYGVSTLRQYRDVAAHWPEGDRVKGLSFSAHRAACPSTDPAGLVKGLIAAHGIEGTTVTRVEAAVELEKSGPAAVAARAAQAAGTAAPSSPVTDLRSARIGPLLRELSRRVNGQGVKGLAPDLDRLVDENPAWAQSAADAAGDLAGYLAGRVKAQGKAQGTFKAPTTTAPTTTAPTTTTAPASAKRRSLRGL